MKFLKSLLRGLAALGFKFGLVTLALVSATIMVFGTSNPLKHALRSSKIYDNVINSLVSVSGQGGDDKGVGSGITLADPPVKQAANTVFSPELLQNSSEQIIDSVYKWLQGKTTKPDFRIDFSAPKLRFAVAAADNAAAHARQLPACTLQQSRELNNTTVDPFSVPCLPPGLDVTTLRNQVISDLANNEDIIKSPVISIDNLPKDIHGKTALDYAHNAPKIFHWVMIAPWVLGGLTILSGAGLVALYDEKRRGLRAIGVISLGSGIFLLVSTWIVTYAFNQINKPGAQLGKTVKNALQNNFIAILQFLSNALNKRLLIFGAVYAGFGVALLLTLHFTKSATEPSLSSVNQDETKFSNAKDQLQKPSDEEAGP